MHVFRGILGRAGTEAVETEGILVSTALVVVVVFTARIQLTEDELPVEAVFGLVVPQRNASAKVLHRDLVIAAHGDENAVAVALARLVDRVCKDLYK